MKNTLLFMALTMLLSGHLYAQEKLNADKDKTKLLWLGEKVTGQHTGTINASVGMA